MQIRSHIHKPVNSTFLRFNTLIGCFYFVLKLRGGLNQAYILFMNYSAVYLFCDVAVESGLMLCLSCTSAQLFGLLKTLFKRLSQLIIGPLQDLRSVLGR